MLIHEDLTQSVIGAAIEVHRTTGPGLLESAYESCLCHELALRCIPFVRQVPCPVNYKGIKLECCYRIDMIVGDIILLELKSTKRNS